MKRLAAFTAAVALLTGGLIAGISAPASADIPVSDPAALQNELATPTDVIQIANDIVVDSTTPLVVGAGLSAIIDLNGQDLEIENLSGDGAGIEVPATSTLTIRDVLGGGSLTATSLQAGIGGSLTADTGTIVIESGTVTAKGSDAGIGGASGNAGTVQISGGTVTATGTFGAGIGAGDGGDGGSVTITGGVVNATSGSGAGIGGGDGSGPVTVLISGGSVTATSTLFGAGIGGGYERSAGSITITGGTVEASTTGSGFDAAAAIGVGKDGNGGSIVISGGSVRATVEGYVVAIGGRDCDLTISGGDVYARGGQFSAIGGIDTSAMDFSGGHIVADTLTTTGPAIYMDAADVATLHGDPSPTSTATDGGDGVLLPAAEYAPVAEPGVTYTATSRAASAPLTITARAEIQFHMSVTFDSMLGIPPPAEQIVDWGDTATEPVVTRSGYIFDGWRVGSASGTEWDFLDPVTEPLSLVAAWVADVATISGTPPAGTYGTAYSYGMTVGGTGTTVALGSGVLPPGLAVNSAGVISGVPTAAGTFAGILEASRPGSAAVQAISITIAAGAAQAVTFDPDGGTPDPGNQMVGLGAKVVEPADPAKVGFAFIEWRVGTNAGPAYDFNQVVTGPLNLVAAWGEQPTLTGPATASGTAGDPITTVQLSKTPPGATVSITSGTLPAGLTFTPATLQVTGVPNGLAGTYPVTFTATNAYGVAHHVVTFTIAHGAATSFTTTASDFTPDQGDTITITVTASDAYGNSWDASGAATITSDVATDVIVGNQVTFPHASPHVLTISLGRPLAAQQLLIQVTARGALGLTGSAGALQALPIAIFTILCGTSLMLLRRRREA